MSKAAMRGVPDAIHHTDTSESLEYITGWNDCRAALLAEQPAPVQDPVAWMHPNGGMLTANYIDKFASGLDKETHSIPLYTTPQAQRKPLTPTLEADTGYSRAQRAAFEEGWQEAEAAHGIKENT